MEGGTRPRVHCFREFGSPATQTPTLHVEVPYLGGLNAAKKFRLCCNCFQDSNSGYYADRTGFPELKVHPLFSWERSAHIIGGENSRKDHSLSLKNRECCWAMPRRMKIHA